MADQSTTFGPAYQPSLDEKRIRKQHEVIRDLMLATDQWLSLNEIENTLGFPQASISAQLRHLRKKRFGSFIVDKRRRDGKGTWEYRVLDPEADPQMELF